MAAATKVQSREYCRIRDGTDEDLSALIEKIDITHPENNWYTYEDCKSQYGRTAANARRSRGVYRPNS